MKIMTMEHAPDNSGLIGVRRKVEWTYGEDQGPGFILEAETPQEEVALRMAFLALNSVLPKHAVRLDQLPALRSNGHGGVEMDPVKDQVNLFIFTKNIPR